MIRKEWYENDGLVILDGGVKVIQIEEDENIEIVPSVEECLDWGTPWRNR